MKEVSRTIEDYKDIIDLPHHVSATRNQMPLKDRAAQFAPFSAVVGHDAAVKEAGRYTDQKKELDEMEKTVINEQLKRIEARLSEMPEVEIVHFKPDETKAGGSYVTKTGRVRKLDAFTKEVLFADGTRVQIEEIYSIICST